jgi:outer membrane receptor protein involved in Fe transport
MKHLVFLLIIIHIALFGKAQSNEKKDIFLTGKIVDEKNNPVHLANVLLFSKADSSVITTTVSDEKGIFDINAKPGFYFLKISFLSYKEKLIDHINLIDKNIALGVLALKTNTDTLKEVVVKSERSMMKLELDKKVFNVGKDLSNVGANASDILNNLPSVTVDVDGTVSLRGSQNVRILIDGKPSALTGTRSTDALRNLQGDLIESIEIITNPSSRYDAAGEAGIINIILKKNKVYGLNGVFNVNMGYPTAFGGSFNVNYRRNKINLFSNYGINYRSTPGKGSSHQQFNSSDTSFVYNQTRSINRSELSHNLIFGLDYFIDNSSTLTGSFLYSPSDGVNKSTTQYEDFNKNNELQQIVQRYEREQETENSIEGSLNFRKKFSEKDHELTADFKYVLGDDIEKTDYTQTVPENNSNIIQRSDNIANERNWLFQTDYIRPFGAEGKIEAGLKTNTRIVKNDYLLEQQDSLLTWIPFPAFNNNMIYTEKIHAAYLMANKKFKRIGLQGGIRVEQSDITTELTKTNEINRRTYFNIFPSATLSYELNEKNTVQLSYSYRINRPEFRDLLPYSNFSDLRSFFKGNPDLNPEFIHSFEAGHLFNWGKGTLLSNAYYRYRTGVIQRIITIDSNGITNIFPVNLATQNAYGIEFNLDLDINSWWKLTSNINLYRAITDGTYNGERMYSETYSGMGRATSKITLFKKWEMQAAFNYRAPRVTPQGKDLATYFIDLGISGDVLKGKGTLVLNVRDLLNSRMRRGIVNEDGYYSESEFQWRARQIMLTFSYRLNRAKEQKKEETDQQESEL